MSDIDTFISTAPALKYAFSIRAKVAPIQDLGTTARGHRRIVDILGGEVSGPRLEGEILPGGADWQVVRPDGTIEVVARYTIKARSGALIYVQNEGLRLQKGDEVYFRTAPRFETADPALRWIETSLFLGKAFRAPDRVVIGFHEVL